MDSKNQKSKADILLERVDQAFIENGLQPPKLTNKKGSLIIKSPEICDKLKKEKEQENDKKRVEELKKQILIADEQSQKAKAKRSLIWFLVCYCIFFWFCTLNRPLENFEDFFGLALGSVLGGGFIMYITLLGVGFILMNANVEMPEDVELNRLKKELDKELKKKNNIWE